MISNLSKEAEKKMLRALEKAADLISDGAHPNEALIKVAADAHIPAGHIHLMVEALNTGHTNAKRMHADDVTDKAASFPMASTPTVLQSLYPDDVHTKQASYENNVVDTGYKTPPRFIQQKKQMEKAAAAINWQMTDKKPEVLIDPNRAMEKACAQVRRSTIDVEDKRLKVAQTRDQATQNLDALRRHFNGFASNTYTEVCDNARILFGKQAEAVLKLAAPKTKVRQVNTGEPVDMTKAPYSLIKKAISLASTFKESQEAFKAAAAAAHNEEAELLRPFVQRPENGRSVLADLSSANTHTKEGGIFSSGLGMLPLGDVAKSIGGHMPLIPQETHKSHLQSLTDPAHEMEIRNIRAEALLNDLLSNDDVVRGYDPEEVVDAYNEVSQLVPYASGHKAIMRDLLRKRLTGGAQALDQFATGDALKSQETLKNLQTIPETKLTTLKDIGGLPSVLPAHAKAR